MILLNILNRKTNIYRYYIERYVQYNTVIFKLNKKDLINMWIIGILFVIYAICKGVKPNLTVMDFIFGLLLVLALLSEIG